MKSMQIVERSRRLLYLYTANVTELQRAIFFLTLVYEELLETSLSLHFSTIFMKNKQLTRCQVNYLDILFKFNFQIIFQSDKMNFKVDALIRMSLINVSESAQRTEDRYQIILTFDKINILAIESEVDLYQ